VTVWARSKRDLTVSARALQALLYRETDESGYPSRQAQAGALILAETVHTIREFGWAYLKRK